MRVIPFEVIAKWPTPNYVNPETRGPDVVILNAVLIAVVTFVVLLRLYVRAYVLRWWGIDDVFIIIALICTMALTACVILANLSYGWDRHLWDLPFREWAGALKLAWATKVIFSASACFTRLALLFFYYRLVQDSGMKWFRNMIHFTVFVSISTMLVLIFITIFQCKPIYAFWTVPLPRNSKCLDDGILTLACGIANTIADLLVVLLPIPLIARLDIQPRRRVGAILLVSLGFVVCIAGAIRSYYTWLSLIHSYDETWETYGVWLSAAVEIDLGVICACAPALRIILVRVCGPQFANLSNQITSLSPFNSKYSNPLESAGSDPRSPASHPKRHSMILREKGFIITKGTTPRRGTFEVPRQEGSGGEPYLWDEPFTGNNGPRATTETERSNEEPKTTTPTPTAEYETAMPVSIKRVDSTKISSLDHRKSAGGISTKLAEPPKVFGVLPDTSTTAGTINDSNSSIPSGSLDSPDQEGSESSETRSSTETRSSKGKRPQVDTSSASESDADDLIIQQPSLIDTRKYSIGFPSIKATKYGAPPPIPPRSPGRSKTVLDKRSNTSSWIDFDFDIPNERRPATSAEPRRQSVSTVQVDKGKGRKRFSFLDDKSRDSFEYIRRSDDLDEELARDRVRSWKIERRADEFGWNGAL